VEVTAGDSSRMSRVAVIGLGAMGSRIAQRLLAAGHDVSVWNRTAEKLTPLVELGATAARTPADAARDAEVVITTVSDPAALQAVTEGELGIAARLGSSAAVIEMSTVGPAAVSRLASLLPADVGLLDAPVLGSIDEAESGALAIFVGGPEALVERWSPLLSVLGTPIHVGGLGAGAAAKLVANSTLFGVLGVLGEALTLAEGLGLSRETAFKVLAKTPLATQAERRRPSIESRTYPQRFSLSLARKDAELITEAAAAAGLDLRLADVQRRRFSDAERAGWGEQDYSAVIGWLQWPASPARPARMVSSTPKASEVAFDGLIVDLDGVVWIGGEPVAGSVAALAELHARQIPLVFLTNDPTHSRTEYAARLTEIGIAATEAEIVSSGSALAALIDDKEGDGRTTFVIGSPSLKQELKQVGLELRDGERARKVDIVAVGGHAGFNYDELRIATQAVRAGARLYAAGRDATFPMPDGPWPATGSILAAVETAAGVRATVAGKPEPYIYALASSLLSGRQRVAIVGDHLEADIAGGKRAGLVTILVLSGTTSAQELEAAEVEPDLVLDDLAGLLDMASVSR